MEKRQGGSAFDNAVMTALLQRTHLLLQQHAALLYERVEGQGVALRHKALDLAPAVGAGGVLKLQ